MSICAVGEVRARPRPSSVGRVTATPPATTPDPPDASAARRTSRRSSGTTTSDDDTTSSAPPAQASRPAPTTTPPQAPIGRIPVQDVSPVVDGGARPAKAVVGEQFTVGATVFREGHDAVNASVVLVGPGRLGAGHRDDLGQPRASTPGAAVVEPDTEGWWTYRVEGWSDPYGTWDHDATIKVDRRGRRRADARGGRPHARARPGRGRPAPPEQQAVLEDAVTALRDTRRPPLARLHAGTDPSVRAELAARPLRDYVSPSTAYPLLVERERALYGAWYEIFPRSEGAVQDPETGKWTSGTLRTAAERLPGDRPDGLRRRLPHADPPDRHDRAQGPEQHPRRRSRRPGQPLRDRLPRRWARRDPPRPRRLRRLRLLRRAGCRARPGGRDGHRAPGLPRPPLRRRPTPSGSRTRADGTIAYAENPPKKYQDIYPLNFDNDPAGVLRRDAPGDPGLDRPRGQDLPRRQPAHQAGRVLAVAHRRRRRATTPT